MNHTRSDAASPVFKRWNRRIIRIEPRKVVGIKSLRFRITCQNAGHPLPMTVRCQLGGGPIDPAPALGDPFQLLQRRVEKPQSARKSSTLDMVISRSELDEPLKKNVNVRLRFEPDRLPRFVRIPEFAGVEMIEPGAEVCGELDHALAAGFALSRPPSFPGATSRTSL